jgi:hypothetical protein
VGELFSTLQSVELGCLPIAGPFGGNHSANKTK